VSFLQKDGKWTEPLNLGNDINSAHMESAPYLAPDNETLYFSSMGFSGYGGADIYISRRLDDTWTNWTEPENLGPDINSPEDDIFFNIPPSGKYAYFAKADESDAGNINRIEMPIFYQPAPVVSISGVVAGKEDGKPVRAKISYKLMPENTDVGFAQSDSLTGEYEILLPVGSAYDFVVEAEGYQPFDGRIDLGEITDFKEMKRNISLEKAGKPAGGELAVAETPGQGGAGEVSEKDIQALINKSVLFDFASDYADVKSYPFLKKIADYLKAHPDKKLYISGHSDNVGPDQYNINLSLRRAKSVLKYFLGQGIPEDRFIVKGYGSKRPVATNQTREGRAKNRRVDFSLH
jgi:outer membrane protein OmpA-like peptidoglycan-associated protein